MENLEKFIDSLSKSLDAGTFVKFTLSKPVQHNDDLRNVYVRRIDVKEAPMVSFTYHYIDNDKSKNFSIADGTTELTVFLQARVFSLLRKRVHKGHLFRH